MTPLEYATPTAASLSSPLPAIATDLSIPLCSPNSLVQQTLVKLISLGCPPLPIAPHRGSSPPSSGPWLSGKNPSFLGRDGRPYLVQHGDFRDRLPTFEQLQHFFAHPDVGIATMGGHQGLVWLDFDAKCYPTPAACAADVEQVIERVLAQSGLTLNALWVEQTGGGGYWLPLRPRRLPPFTRFTTTPEGPAVGEMLGQGQCAVLAPTKHPNGQLYRVLQAGLPAPVESLTAVGLYPVTAHQGPLRSPAPPRSQPFQSRFRIKRSPDMRQLATWLDGYHERGEWGYARCPGTATHPSPQSCSSLSVHLGTGAFHLFCGCERGCVYRKALALAQQRGFAVP